MRLILSVLRCPDAATPGTRSIPGGDYTLGRAEGCDWVLSDPDRLLSRRHCTLEFRDGFWSVRDLSVNGTFVNASSVPVGRDQAAPLEDGDRLRLGGYEFEVRVEGDARAPTPGAWSSLPAGGGLGPPPFGQAPGGSPFGGSPAAPGGGYGAAPPGAGYRRPSPNPAPFDAPGGFRPDARANDALRDPFAGEPDPFQAAPPIQPVQGFVPVGDERGMPSRPDDRPSMVPPAMDFDPFADRKLGPQPGFDDPFGPTRPDHAPATSDAFVPPRANFGAALPADWNAAPSPPPSAAGWQEPDWDALLSDLRPTAPTPSAAPDPMAPPAAPFPTPAATPADPFAPAGFGAPAAEPFPPAAGPFPAAPPPAAAPVADPFAPAGFGAPAVPPPAPAVPPSDLPSGPPSGPPMSAADRDAASPSEGDPFAERPGYAALPAAVPARAVPAGPGDAAGLDAFLRGANLAPLPPGTDPDASLYAAGVALRAAIGGLRALLIARADVKRAFRIEQTMLSRRDNNPVKFAATDEASLAALLTLPNGASAVEETVEDLTRHQVATLAATQAAARALLDRVAPAEVEAANPGGGGLLGGREKALWAAYKATHAKLIEQFEDDFDSAFGRAFARAYEEAAKANTRTE
ncbi:type VI secretion system-associated FHA domain protein TagH [Roseomonas sp. CCTCC AB2023176]|uniref:type VI secretion system-associated FHA domain protein TagH n=1 Tax=Roseomonas sp. CCTCC AB2023176 TaxID=3342640 RepID=UPI0035DC3911